MCFFCFWCEYVYTIFIYSYVHVYTYMYMYMYILVCRHTAGAPSTSGTHTVYQFSSISFTLSPVGARTLYMSVPYPLPNVGASGYTRTPSHIYIYISFLGFFCCWIYMQNFKKKTLKFLSRTIFPRSYWLASSFRWAVHLHLKVHRCNTCTCRQSLTSCGLPSWLCGWSNDLDWPDSSTPDEALLPGCGEGWMLDACVIKTERAQHTYILPIYNSEVKRTRRPGHGQRAWIRMHLMPSVLAQHHDNRRVPQWLSTAAAASTISRRWVSFYTAARWKWCSLVGLRFLLASLKAIASWRWKENIPIGIRPGSRKLSCSRGLAFLGVVFRSSACEMEQVSMRAWSVWLSKGLRASMPGCKFNRRVPATQSPKKTQQQSSTPRRCFNYWFKYWKNSKFLSEWWRSVSSTSQTTIMWTEGDMQRPWKCLQSTWPTWLQCPPLSIRDVMCALRGETQSSFVSASASIAFWPASRCNAGRRAQRSRVEILQKVSSLRNFLHTMPIVLSYGKICWLMLRTTSHAPSPIVALHENETAHRTMHEVI